MKVMASCLVHGQLLVSFKSFNRSITPKMFCENKALKNFATMKTLVMKYVFGELQTGAC